MPLDEKQKHALWCKIKATEMRRQPDEIALGYLRYEALRKINGFQFTTLRGRNLNGENFDGMVDELVLGGTILGGGK